MRGLYSMKPLLIAWVEPCLGEARRGDATPCYPNGHCRDMDRCTVMTGSWFWLRWALVTVALAGLLCLVVAPPFVGEDVRYLIMVGFSNACHQIPARSPHIAGVPLAVCDRCLGIYAALSAAPFLVLLARRWDALLRRRARYLILGALLIPGADWAMGVVGLWANTPWSRLFTGAAFGIVAGYFLTQALVGLPVRRGGDRAS